jgi:uncharacterized protein (TIGR02284 family)
MNKREQTIDLLNTLIQTNIDRVKGYDRAAQDLQFAYSLKSVFYNLAEESMRFKDALAAEVKRLGGIPATESTTGGDVFRMWMQVKNSLTDDQLLAVLQSVEFGENVAFKTYKRVLSQVDHPAETIQLIQGQVESLKASRNLIRRNCDEYFAKENQTVPQVAIG